MYLKDKNRSPRGGFVFYFQHVKTMLEIRVPTKGGANGIPQLTTWSGATLRGNGMDVPDNLAQIVEHQICIRQKLPLKACYSGGIGDDIHHKVMKPILGKVAATAKRFGAKRVAKVAKKAAGCSGCGGRRTYEQGKNNLGRAAKLNRLNSGKFALNADHKR